MKNIFFSIILLFLLQVGSAVAQTQIPTELHGYWQLKDQINGMNVGINYVEFGNDLYTADSIRHSDNQYTIYLTREENQHLTLNIELQANDSAIFKFDEVKILMQCKHFDRNPEIDYLPKSDYSKVITGKWFTDSNTREPLAIQKGKLLYNGKRWNIIWLGENKKREYQTLIENAGNYRLISISKQEDNSLKIIYFQQPSIYKPLSEANGKLTLFGNWFEPVSNKWIFGFFEKFAIYDGKFWDYKTLNITKNKGTATLKNGIDTLQLTFKNIKDSTLQVLINKQKVVTYHLAGRTLPNYKSADTTSFIDNHFARIDTAYITGYLRNRTTNKPYEITLHDVITDVDVSYYGNVDDAGRFEIKVPLYNSSMALMDWEQMAQISVLEPNEHYFLFYDENTKQTLYMGNNTRFQNEMATLDIFGIPNEEPEKNLKPINFLDFQKKLLDKKRDYINSIFYQMPAPSEKFRNYLNNSIKFDIAYNLMQYRFKLDWNNNEKLPDEYLAFVKKTMLTNPVNLIPLDRSLFYFITDYVGYYDEQKGGSCVQSDDALFSLVNTNKLNLDKSDKELVYLFCNYKKLINKSDSLEARKLAEKITTKENERFHELLKQYEEQIQMETSTMLSNMDLKREIETINAEIQDRNIRDCYLAGALFEKLNNEKKPMDTKLLDSMIMQVQSPVFREKIVGAQKFYTELSGQSLNFTESLKNTEHLSEAKDADSLWQELIRPYKGKIIYVDFWGTWCGSCREEMKYVADLKKQFIGKDIVFMYLANNSPEDRWKNILKTYSLTGENVVQYRLPDEQQAMIERRFGVNSFPTYLIVDKNGNVVDTDPPRPSQTEKTVGFLNDWLEKKN